MSAASLSTRDLDPLDGSRLGLRSTSSTASELGPSATSSRDSEVGRVEALLRRYPALVHEIDAPRPARK